MARIDVESALHEALTDAAIGQPAAPVDRLVGVRRRHQRRRIAQGVGAAVAVIAVVAGTVAGIGLPGSHRVSPAHRSLPSWALPWPDHRDHSVPQSVLDGAVTAWRHLASDQGGQAPVAAPSQVVWYLGNRIANGEVVAVVFEVAGVTGHRLVAGWTSSDEVMQGQAPYDGQNASTPWVLYDVPAPASNFQKFIGLNVHGQSADTSMNPDNWIVVLAGPNADLMHTGAVNVGAPMAVGDHALDQGLGIVDTGQLQSEVEVSVRYPDHVWAGGNVGVTGAPESFVPQLAAAPALTGVIGQTYASSGQGAEFNVDGTQPPHATSVTVYIRCLGPSPLRFTLDGQRSQSAQVTCDGQQHKIPGLRFGQPTAIAGQAGHTYDVHASKLTAWRYALVAHY